MSSRYVTFTSRNDTRAELVKGIFGLAHTETHANIHATFSLVMFYLLILSSSSLGC